LVVIISGQTTRNTSQPVDEVFTQAIRPLFASVALWSDAIGPVWDVEGGESAPPDETILGLKPAVAFPVEVKADHGHFSWDFGVSDL
jgi:hypothetical protein